MSNWTNPSKATNDFGPAAPPRRPPKLRRGFTIVEALIATAILSASVSVVFVAHSNAAAGTQLAAERTRARLHLESLLAEAGSTAPLKTGEQSGRMDARYSWRLSIEPYAPRDAAALESVSALTVTATVSWRSRGAERSLSLSTVRLQGAPL